MTLKSYGITPIVKWSIVKRVAVKRQQITAHYA